MKSYSETSLDSGRNRLATAGSVAVEQQATRCTEALGASESQLRTITDALPVLISYIDTDQRYRFANHAYEEWFGQPRSEIIGRRVKDILGPAAYQTIAAHIEAVLAGRPVTFEHVRHYKHVEPRVVYGTYVPDIALDGRVLGFFALITDITERKHAERALRESQEQLAGIIGSAMDAIITMDDQQGIVLFNAAAERMFRCSSRDALGSPIDRFIPERFRASHAEHHRSFAESGITSRRLGQLGTVAALRADGDEFPAEIAISQTGADGKRVFTAIVRDITDRKRAERALQESEERYRQLFERSSSAVAIDEMVFDAQGHPCDYRFLDVNPAFEQMTGLRRERVVGRTVLEILPGVERYWIDLFGKVASTGQPATFDHYAQPLGRHYEGSAYCPRPGRFVASFTDVTERKQTEQALRQSEQRLRLLLDSTTEAICGADLESNCTFCNPAAARLLGYHDANELQGKNLHALMHHTQADGKPLPLEECRIYQAFSRGLSFHTDEEIFWRRDGSSFPVECWSHPILQDGRPLGTVLTFLDITERKRAEEELARKMQELARSNQDLEQFAYVASHDLQEPLRMVASYTQLLAERYQDKLDENADKYIRYAIEGAMRMQTLLEDMLAFSRVGRNGFVMTQADCRVAVEEALQNLHAAIQEGSAEVKTGPLPAVTADRTQLRQLFQNLIGNAIKFRSSAPPMISVGVEEKGEEWQFAVSDNGIGIAPEHTQAIFAIFQRLHTRTEYPGNGIGLAICKRIVERHGGRIWVESQPGEGSTFRFTIPVRKAEGPSPDNK
jgi:PAS domain S-box-containing protein